MNRFKVGAAIFCVSLVALAFPFGVKAVAVSTPSPGISIDGALLCEPAR